MCTGSVVVELRCGWGFDNSKMDAGRLALQIFEQNKMFLTLWGPEGGLVLKTTS